MTLAKFLKGWGCTSAALFLVGVALLAFNQALDQTGVIVVLVLSALGGFWLYGFVTGVRGGGGYAGPVARHGENPPDYNPANGLPMMGPTDIQGNPYGTDDHKHW